LFYLKSHPSWQPLHFFIVFSARFGVHAEVLIDQGRKFFGSFEELCTKTLIDHRTTSRDHLEVDGLADCIVQMVKWDLCKYGLLRGNHRDWDLILS